MIKIENSQDLISKLGNSNLPINVIKDITFQTFIIDTQLPSTGSAIYILDTNETIPHQGSLPEIEEQIDGYKNT